MKTFTIFVVFLLAGLFYVTSVNYAEAGVVGGCVDLCQFDCNAGPENTFCRDQELRGEERRICNIIENKLAECCFQECLEEECGIEGSEDVICDLLEEECDIPE